MQIQVKCNCGEQNCPEWAIVELQGVIEPQPAFQDRLQHLEIGQLCRPSSQTYTFTVGYHELTGSKVPLKKPLLVLKKIRHADDEKVELEVIGIIRQRILFKTRPKALISRPQPVVKERVSAPGSLVPS
ncbi:Chromosome transmission fidelity protein [Actinidia chinensis var. chinensis]|uniref:Chromosome transmission fidelity protein n=1 Tax=Actinidia chinensis var. chinensis TaxID=1590841 RepID=A0A2R6PM74_ACTCC|nr:Chromosome transmission fidelity protein [Actinidia chinensis var. chinensis]